MGTGAFCEGAHSRGDEWRKHQQEIVEWISRGCLRRGEWGDNVRVEFLIVSER